MQDNKALQAGTSHNLGQNFAKAFDLKFQAESGGIEYAWNTSWGVSTRLIGGLVMTHGDDNGLAHSAAARADRARDRADLEERRGAQRACSRRRGASSTASRDWERREPDRLRVHLDDREGMKPGAKYYEWELRGVPLRLELGPRDLDKNQACSCGATHARSDAVSLDTHRRGRRRRCSRRSRTTCSTAARERRESEQPSASAITYDRVPASSWKATGGFVYAGWCGDAACEAEVKEDTKATIRVLPDEEFRSAEAPTYVPAVRPRRHGRGVWARAY